MEFIFMLTRDDRTIEYGPDLLGLLRGTGIRHVGFKDVGVDLHGLRRIRDAIAGLGATSYLEAVATGDDATLDAARVAADLGVECLLGGTRVEETLEIIADTGISYFPFPGFPSGHPTVLRGSPADIAGHCARFMEQGCAGADLLAYRARDAEPLALVRAARKSLGGGRLIVAGSISSERQIADLAAAGADAFTVGTAILEDTAPGDVELIRDRVAAILAACEAADSGAAHQP